MLASLTRILWLLDSKGLQMLYKAQVRYSMEYSRLAWGGVANKHLFLLDKVQARAVRLIRDNGADQEPTFHSLQHHAAARGTTSVSKTTDMLDGGMPCWQHKIMGICQT